VMILKYVSAMLEVSIVASSASFLSTCKLDLALTKVRG